MSDEEEKEIILRHNDKYFVKVKIKNDYDAIINAVKEALYYSDDEIKNLVINFIDDEECENTLDEDNIEEAFEAKEWITRRKDSPGPKPTQDGGDVEKLKREISQLKSQIRNNSSALQEAIQKCNENYKQQLEQLKNKFVEELKKRENLNKENLEQIQKELTECATSKIKSKVEESNIKIKEELNSKIEKNKTNLNNGIEEISSILKTIDDNKKEISKQIIESNENFTKIYELSQVNIK